MRTSGLTVALGLLFCVAGWAQDTATIVGTVTDPSGGVVPGAKVTVSNPEKGFTRELATNAAGEYTAAKIPIGHYVVSAEKSGFQKLVRSGITLAVGQTLRVDLPLQVGQNKQQVTVAGNLPHVETETAAVSDVVTGTQISNLELNGRNFVQLALLVPGAAPTDFFLQNASSVGIGGDTAISFNGGRPTYNNWEVDGGNNTDEGAGVGNMTTSPSLDTIAEFRISTSNYGAEMGKHAGATIEVATKSGTRDFHGEVFEYLRNDRLDSNGWFVNRQRWDGLNVQQDCNGNPAGPCNAPKTPLKWNDFGYNLGGPFYIPGHYNTDKSKTFFFWSQNWRRYRQGTVVSGSVPTPRMRQGDFSECDPASPNYNSVLVSSGCVLPTNPTTGQPFPGQIVPVDPNAQALLNAFVPLPNNGVTGYLSVPTIPTDWRQEQIRVDQNIGQKTRLFVRYTQDAWNETEIPGWNWNSVDSVQTNLNAPGKSAVLNLAHTFKPNLMNEFVVAYTVDHVTAIPAPGPGSPAGSLDKPATWTAVNLFAANKANPLLPSIGIGGGTPFLFGADASNFPFYNSNSIFTLKDNAVYSRGRHTLKFGFFFEDFHKNEQFGFNTQGLMQFFPGTPISTGNALADMDLGLIGQYQEGTGTVNGQPVGGYPKGHWQMTDFEPYVQDDWKVSRKLTLNLGLRYYLFSRIHNVSNPTVDSNFFPNLYDPAKQAQLDAYGNLIPGTGQTYQTYGNGLLPCGVGGVPQGCSLPSYSTLAPRFGFAYDPWGTGKTVIRGGYGIYYEIGNGQESNSMGTRGNPPVSLAPAVSLVTGYQNILPGALAPVAVSTLPYEEPWGSVQQFSLGVQHELPGNNLLGLSYVGALGRHLSRSRDLDQIPIGVGFMKVPALAGIPGCDAAGNCDVQQVLIYDGIPNTYFLPYRGYLDIAMKENTAVSSYNALQVSFRHPFGQGLTFQASYTWSHAVDDASAYSYRSYVDDSNLGRWRATSDLNRAQVLVMNFVYALPFFKTSPNRLARNALGGWQVSGITSFLTGTPIDVGCRIVGFQNGIGTNVRCNSLAAVKNQKGVDIDPQFGPTPTWFDGNTFAQPLEPQLRADGQPGMFGYMGRNPLTGPGRNNWDMALLKNFQLPWFGGEHSTLQFRWETFNTFNHPQWQGVNFFCNGSTNADGGPAFGRPCGGHDYNLGNGQINSAWPSRIMQFALNLIF